MSGEENDLHNFTVFDNSWQRTQITTATSNSSNPLCNNATDPIVLLRFCQARNIENYSRTLGFILVACVTIIMFSMGCTIKVKKLKERIMRPWGILIGFICQFGIMPLGAFTAAHLLHLSQAQALVVLIMGCLPGGNASNLVSYWCDGDMDLSIAMTTTSTLMAFAMMPLCLYIYTPSFIDEAISIPYTNICYLLSAFIAPVIVGMLVNHRNPVLARRLAKIGAIIGIVVISIAATIGIILYPGAFKIVPVFWVAGSILPALGYCLGYTTAFAVDKMGKRDLISDRQKRTIAIETGMQNTQLCSTIVQLNYGCTCMILDMYSYPMVYFLLQVVEALTMCVIFQLLKRLHRTDGRRSSDDVEISSYVTPPRSVLCDNSPSEDAPRRS